MYVLFVYIQSRNESTVKLPKSHSENLELNGDRKMADITNGASSLSISQCRMVGGIVPSPQVSVLVYSEPLYTRLLN